MVDALVAEEAGEDAAVGGEAGERDPDVVSDAEDLALVRGELVGGLVGGGEVEDTDQVDDGGVDLGARPNSLPAFPPFCSLASLPLGEEGEGGG